MIKYIIGIFVILIILVRTKIRGFFWKDKNGNELSFKQFIKRWGEGIEGITPLQQSKTQLMGTWITFSGILAGIVVNALVRMENVWWWVEIILVGSGIITSVQLISSYQKYKKHKQVDKTFKELNNKLKKKC